MPLNFPPLDVASDSEGAISSENVNDMKAIGRLMSSVAKLKRQPDAPRFELCVNNAMTSQISPPARIVIFGDSITEALDLPESERANAWASIVQAKSNGKILTINEGKGGRPTDSIAEFRSMLHRHRKIDVLVIALGANDARDISDICAANATSNIREMIGLARQTYGEGFPILIVAPTNIRKDALGPTRPIANEREAKLIELGAAFRALASEECCHFVSLYGVLPLETLGVDGVHPDSEGHSRLANIMLRAILDIITPHTIYLNSRL
jgi:acyl-CoA thioesterase I